MRLSSRLERWQQAGLLTEAQVTAILEHESENNRFTWQNGLYFVAIFAIVMGVLAIIAANWQQIPGTLKIAIHLIVNCALAIVVLREDRSRNHRGREVGLLLWFGLNLTFIGLIGQVFHLDGNLPGALLLWIALSSPAIVLLSDNKFTLMLWLVACLATLFGNYGEYLHPTVDNLMVAAVVFVVLLPAAMMAISYLLEGTTKIELRRQLASMAPLVLVLGASVVCQFWYDLGTREDMAEPRARYTGIAALLLGMLVSFYPRMTVPHWLGNTANARWLLLAANVAVAGPFLLYELESDLMAALSFIAFWLLLGYLAHRNNTPRLISLVILVVTIRVYVIYLEVFGSMLQTGVGLIGSGLLLLAMLKAAQLVNRNLRGGTSAGGGMAS